MPTRVDKQTGNCRECQGGLTCMHCHPESAPMDAHRIAELEAALGHLWDAAVTVHHDGDRGCFVAEANWRKAMAAGPMRSKK